MNRRKLLGGFGNLPQTALAALIICSVFFAVGSIIGVFFASSNSGSYADLLNSYVSNIASLEDSVLPGVAGTFLWLSKYTIFAFICGFSILGIAIIPAVFMLRGFVLSFTLAVFFRTFGSDGVLLALLISGICALISVPCFFTVSVQAFLSSLRLYSLSVHPDGGLRTGVYTKRYFLRFLLCIVVLIAAAFAESAVFTYIVPSVAGSI
ncbi:MAG: hypothetical protein ACI3VB_07365 [Oscillospiraceae bacterium]